MSSFIIKIGRFAIVKKGVSGIKGVDGYWKQWYCFAVYVKTK